ncbi:membrane metalloprotease [Mariniflexile sp. AS56]|uniref:membrane metalloprotease n=1 Tax=Mariniflexile sp. AS56 TaxID=3063957 RepID=UPI0026F33A73|nr:membrane metalloprotease [Mariniflexile sp. AS56]MDO7171808.1 membrane metalloprotease [Mariniflexile sp. AS56]
MKKITTLLLLFVLIASCTTEEATETITDNETPTDSKIANQKNTGSSSNDLLSDATFKSMVIELVYVEGFKPTQSSINNFVSFLQARTFKPSGITVESRAIPSPGNAPYTNQEIVAIEDANRTKYNSSNQIAVWAFFADGSSASNTNSGVVLGTAYRNTSFVIYEETIHDLSNSPFEPNRTVLETTVISHEFGHILGLTNLGATMVQNHEDTDHAKHCNVETCLMYWSAESGSGLDNLVGANSAPELDAQCIADLQANGGK